MISGSSKTLVTSTHLRVWSTAGLSAIAKRSSRAYFPAMDPITFYPIYKTRVWGGRELEKVYHRTLPDSNQPYGESWEIVDRENEQSIVDTGPFAGISLHELWTNQRSEIFGENLPPHPRFPLLIKILDARQDLSVQVHPPAHLAESLGGESKTEMWYIADCDPNSKLYVGLKNGITRDAFERAINDGTVADCIHTLTPNLGDSIFIRSGRLHAIGAGFLIHEIQQNSDTTYRVFDWNRLDLDGNPRELHIGESLASIDFQDFEPTMDLPEGDNLASCEYFITERKFVKSGESIAPPRDDRFTIISIIVGEILTTNGRAFQKGQFLLLPRGASPLTASCDTTLLQITLP